MRLVLVGILYVAIVLAGGASAADSVAPTANDTFYLYYCACGNKGRGIGLITSRPLPPSE